MLARPPPGFRTTDERGVEVLWLMNNPLYGQLDAGVILRNPQRIVFQLSKD